MIKLPIFSYNTPIERLYNFYNDKLKEYGVAHYRLDSGLMDLKTGLIVNEFKMDNLTIAANRYTGWLPYKTPFAVCSKEEIDAIGYGEYYEEEKAKFKVQCDNWESYRVKMKEEQ